VEEDIKYYFYSIEKLLIYLIVKNVNI